MLKRTDIIDPTMLRRAKPMLRAPPKPMSLREIHAHMNQLGHAYDPISSDALARIKIKCPIYWDNEARTDVLFNNYKCTCGKLFIVSNKVGACPCDTCDYWVQGCRHGLVRV